MNNVKKYKKTIECKRYRFLTGKIRDIKGTFHARIGMIKERNGKDLTEKEEIKRDFTNTQN